MTTLRKTGGFFPSIWDEFDEDVLDSTDLMLRGGTILPSCNIRDREGSYEVEIAAPGMKKEDFKVELRNNILTVSSEKKYEEEEKNKKDNYMRREFRYSAFERNFTLPNSAKSEKISAEYKDGVLTVNIPKKEEVIKKSPQLIEVS